MRSGQTLEPRRHTEINLELVVTDYLGLFAQPPFLLYFSLYKSQHCVLTICVYHHTGVSLYESITKLLSHSLAVSHSVRECHKTVTTHYCRTFLCVLHSLLYPRVLVHMNIRRGRWQAHLN